MAFRLYAKCGRAGQVRELAHVQNSAPQFDVHLGPPALARHARVLNPCRSLTTFPLNPIPTGVFGAMKRKRGGGA